jgi:hypothetical protein
MRKLNDMENMSTCSFLFSFSFLGWGENWVHLVRRPLIGLLYQPRMIVDECGAVGGMRIATLSTTNPTLPDLGSKPGRRGGKPATNRLSYGAA